jgi:hypothetical protein
VHLLGKIDNNEAEVLKAAQQLWWDWVGLDDVDAQMLLLLTIN